MKYDDDFFGTMFDFNGDGHTDMSEEFLAFQMMNEADKQDEYVPKKEHRPIIRSGGARVGLVLVALVLAIIGWLYFFGLIICNCVTSNNSCSGRSKKYDYSYELGSYLEYNENKQSTTRKIYTESGEIEVPYVGMSESDINNTSLGSPSENVRHNWEAKNGNQYTANLYDYYNKDGEKIFTARCIQGKVTEVWDKRDNPVKPYTPKSKNSKSKSSKSSDEYNAKDYANADDFYYDYYDDFYDYEEAEDYYNEHND